MKTEHDCAAPGDPLLSGKEWREVLGPGVSAGGWLMVMLAHRRRPQQQMNLLAQGVRQRRLLRAWALEALQLQLLQLSMGFSTASKHNAGRKLTGRRLW